MLITRLGSRESVKAPDSWVKIGPLAELGEELGDVLTINSEPVHSWNSVVLGLFIKFCSEAILSPTGRYPNLLEGYRCWH